MTDINLYLSFVLKLFFAFGLAFEVPVATVLLVKVGATTPGEPCRKASLHYRRCFCSRYVNDSTRYLFSDVASDSRLDFV